MISLDITRNTVVNLWTLFWTHIDEFKIIQFWIESYSDCVQGDPERNGKTSKSMMMYHSVCRVALNSTRMKVNHDIYILKQKNVQLLNI